MWKKGSSGSVTQWRQLVSCDWSWHSHGSLIPGKFDLKINRSMKTPWQEYSGVACSYSCKYLRVHVTEKVTRNLKNYARSGAHFKRPKAISRLVQVHLIDCYRLLGNQQLCKAFDWLGIILGKSKNIVVNQFIIAWIYLYTPVHKLTSFDFVICIRTALSNGLVDWGKSRAARHVWHVLHMEHLRQVWHVRDNIFLVRKCCPARATQRFLRNSDLVE